MSGVSWHYQGSFQKHPHAHTLALTVCSLEDWKGSPGCVTLVTHHPSLGLIPALGTLWPPARSEVLLDPTCCSSDCHGPQERRGLPSLGSKDSPGSGHFLRVERRPLARPCLGSAGGRGDAGRRARGHTPGLRAGRLSAVSSDRRPFHSPRSQPIMHVPHTRCGASTAKSPTAPVGCPQVCPRVCKCVARMRE